MTIVEQAAFAARCCEFTEDTGHTAPIKPDATDLHREAFLAWRIWLAGYNRGLRSALELSK